MNQPFDQDARTARALRTVAEDYTFSAHDPGAFICESPAGNAYLVSDESCTCGDWMHRASQVGGRCKHMVALSHRLLAEGALLEPAKPAAPQPAAPDYAAISAKLSADLGRSVTWGQAEEDACRRIFG